MPIIRITRDKIVTVDDEWFDVLSRHSWQAVKIPRTDVWYAQRIIWLPGKKKTTILMHRFITGAVRGQRVDHIDHNGLNNCVDNLRIATQKRNNQNRRKLATGTTSRFKGVSWSKSCNKWRATIGLSRAGRHWNMTLGFFSDEVVAAHAYDAAARIHFGAFACVNFPEPGESAAI